MLPITYCALSFTAILPGPVPPSQEACDRPLYPAFDLEPACDFAAMAVGDLDLDGIDDLLVADRLTDRLQTFFGGAPFGFGVGPTTALDGTPYDIAVDHLDGDGILDVLVATDGLLSVFLGEGGGAFGPEHRYDTLTTLGPLVTADLDSDGHLDVVAGDEAQSRFLVYKGRGGGAFHSPDAYAVPDDLLEIVALDLDADGVVDLATSAKFPTSSHASVRLYLGNGDGTFRPGRALRAGRRPRGLVSADFDANGLADLAFGDGESGDVLAYVGGVDGVLSLASISSVDGHIDTMAQGDFDADGWIDLAVALGYEGYSLLSGKGDGAFEVGSTTGHLGSSRSAAVADFDDNGFDDLAVLRTFDGGARVMFGEGSGTFPEPYELESTGSSTVLATDLDQDAIPDLVTIGSTAGTVAVRPGIGDGTFGDETEYDAGISPYRLADADLDLDGRFDVVSAPQFANKIAVLLGDDGGGLAAPLLTPMPTPVALALGDFDGDGRPDLAAANEHNDIAVSSGLGDGLFAPSTEHPIGALPTGIDAGDVDNDGDLDLVAVSLLPPKTSVLLGNDDGSFVSVPAVDGGTAGGAMLLIDLNHDGCADLVKAQHGVQVRISDCTGSFGAVTTFATHGSPASIAAADLNADGHVDIVVGSGSTELVSVLLGDGTGSLATPMNHSMPDEPSALAIADLDGNGWQDLVVEGFDDLEIFLGSCTE